jgi:transcriptional regulator with XRE-family HTH domain
MATPQSPVGSRRRLGAELRRLRTNAGLTLDEVAEKMTCSTSKISRLETGKGIPKIPDVRELMRIYGVSSDTEQDMLVRLVHDGREHGWWESYTDGVPPERFMMDAPDRYAALESEAAAISAFEVAILHGLVQTPDYTRCVLDAILPARDPGVMERLVELRRRRQERLQERGVRFSLVVDESALRRTVGSGRIMVQQLKHLLEVSVRPGTDVRVLPFGVGFHRALAGPFVLLEFPPGVGSDVVYFEGHAGDTYLENASDVDLYKGILADVTARALDNDESRSLIARCLDTHDDKEGPAA